jgi:hypothetical protein
MELRVVALHEHRNKDILRREVVTLAMAGVSHDVKTGYKIGISDDEIEHLVKANDNDPDNPIRYVLPSVSNDKSFAFDIWAKHMFFPLCCIGFTLPSAWKNMKAIGTTLVSVFVGA